MMKNTQCTEALKACLVSLLRPLFTWILKRFATGCNLMSQTHAHQTFLNAQNANIPKLLPIAHELLF